MQSDDRVLELRKKGVQYAIWTDKDMTTAHSLQHLFDFRLKGWIPHQEGYTVILQATGYSELKTLALETFPEEFI